MSAPNAQASGLAYGSLDRRFILLRPCSPPQRQRPATLLQPPGQVAAALAQLVAAAEPIHLDFETTGLDAADLAQQATNLALANSAGVWSWDVRDWGPNHWGDLAQALRAVGWIAFNAPFDGAWLTRYTHPALLDSMVGCSSALFRLLANEGYTGQRHNLEVAVRDVLGWPTNQKDALAEMLAAHRIRSKSEMWRLADLEPHGYALYNAFDADASWQLWTHLRPQAAAHPALDQYLRDEWPCMLRLLIRQYHTGVTMDRAGLEAYRVKLLTERDLAVEALRGHPRTHPHVTAWEATAAVEFYAPHVTRKRHRADMLVELRLNAVAAGAQSQALDGETWYFHPSTAKSLRPHQKVAGGYWYREEPVYTPRNEGKPAPQVNWDADAWVRELLYTHLYRWEWLEPPAPDAKRPGKLRVYLEGTDYVDVRSTDGGLPPTGKEVLPALGEIGRLLTQYNQLTKRLEYVESYLAASAMDGKIHPQLRAPGTATGRLASGGGS